MKPEDLPYTYKNFPENHDKIYTEDPRTLKHVEFELSLIEKHHSKERIISWCDAGCGTGWHLRNTNVNKARTGIDREQNMLNYAKKMKPFGPQWINCDINNIYTDIGTFDLITHFWYGYIHQLTLDDVQKTLLSLIKATAENGTFIIGVCDPVGWSQAIQHQNPITFENDLFIDSVIWSYEDPFTKTKYANCIAPHPTLIWRWLEPYFTRMERVTYPISKEAPEWERYAYVCSHRNDKEIIFNGE